MKGKSTNLRHENIEPITYMCRVAKSLRFFTSIKIFTCFLVSKVNYFKRLYLIIGFQEFWSFLWAAQEKKDRDGFKSRYFFILYFFGKNHIKLSVNILEINASESKYIYKLFFTFNSYSSGKKTERKKRKIYTLI